MAGKPALNCVFLLSPPFPAKLQAAVVLNPGYSSIPPIFQLCLNWKGEKTNNNDDNIRVRSSEGDGRSRESLLGPGLGARGAQPVVAGGLGIDEVPGQMLLGL